MLRLTAFSLILTLVFATLTFLIVASPRRDLPAGVGSIVFQMMSRTGSDPQWDVELLKQSNFWSGEQFETLIDPTAEFYSPYLSALDCSPDGQSLLFVAPQNFYRLNVKDKALQSLIYTPGDVRTLVWSPDEKQIAYSQIIGTQFAIFTANADGSHPSQILANKELKTSLSWSPDSREIALSAYDAGDNKIEILDVITHAVKQIYQSKIFLYNLSWSPDGARIAFEMGENANVNIYTIQPDGSHLTRLINNNQQNVNPRWSPDGSLISYSSLDSSGHFQLYVMNADGSDPRIVFAGLNEVDNLCWLPPQKETS